MSQPDNHDFLVDPGDAFTDGKRLISVESTTPTDDDHSGIPTITASGFQIQTYQAFDEAVPLLSQYTDSVHIGDLKGSDTLLIRLPSSAVTTHTFAPKTIETLIQDSDWTLLPPQNELIENSVYTLADIDSSVVDIESPNGEDLSSIVEEDNN